MQWLYGTVNSQLNILHRSINCAFDNENEKMFEFMQPTSIRPDDNGSRDASLKSINVKLAVHLSTQLKINAISLCYQREVCLWRGCWLVRLKGEVWQSLSFRDADRIMKSLRRNLRSSLGLPVPNMLAFFSEWTTVFTGSFTVLGRSCNLGRAAAASDAKQRWMSIDP